MLLPVTAVFAQGNTIIVKVGENNGLTYDPVSVTANNGDTVAFQFLAKNHTVSQSTFAAPCQLMTTPSPGIDSGFQAVPANATSIPQWSFTITNNSTPLWFFCRQVGHCQKGMVFAVNPTAQKSYSAFLANAMGNGSSTSGHPTSSSGGSHGTPSPSDGSGVVASDLPSASTKNKVNGGLALYGGNFYSSNAAIITLLGFVAGLVL